MSNRKFTKYIISTAAALALLAAVSPFTANAASISGSVAFGGSAILNNPNSSLATQASVPLAFCVGSTGDISTFLGVGAPIVFNSPLVFGVTTGLLWTGGLGNIFSFTANAPITALAGPNNTLSVSAWGLLKDSNGQFDPTLSQFTMAITPTANGVGAFGSVTVPTSAPSVPEPAMGFAGVLALAGLIGLPGLKKFAKHS